jgi:hypothetical protein
MARFTGGGAGSVGPQGPPGPAGEDGEDGQMYGNFDGGDADSVYGGIAPVNGGDSGSF